MQIFDSKGKEIGQIDKAFIEKEAPEVFNEIKNMGIDEGKQSAEKTCKEKQEAAKNEVITAEKDRVTKIIEAAGDSQGAIAISCIKEGKSVEESKDLFLNDIKEKLKVKENKDNFDNGAANPADHVEKSDKVENIDPEKYWNDCEGVRKAYEDNKQRYTKAVEEWKKSDETRSEFGNNFQAYIAYYAGKNLG